MKYPYKGKLFRCHGSNLSPKYLHSPHTLEGIARYNAGLIMAGASEYGCFPVGTSSAEEAWYEKRLSDLSSEERKRRWIAKMYKDKEQGEGK